MHILSLNMMRVAAVLWATILIISCRRSQEILLPQELVEYPQPISVPLELNDAQPLHWDTIGKADIKPAVFPLDFNKIKAQPYDPTGFKPLSSTPVEIPFDFSALPSQPFDLDKVPAHQLKMKMEPLPAELPSTNFVPPVRTAGSPLDIKQWQQMSNGTISNLMVTAVVIDNDGFIWMATTNGLYRFDGNQVFTVIPGAYIMGMCVDKIGNLWYVESREALSELVKVNFKDRFMGRCRLNLRVTYFTKLIAAADGKLWIPAGVSPLLVADPVTLLLQALDTSSALKSTRYHQVAFDRAGRTWLSSRNGIDIIEPASKKLFHLAGYSGAGGDTTSAIISAPDDRMWASTQSGVVTIDYDKGKITRYTFDDLEKPLTFQLLLDRTGQLWRGTLSGLDIFNPRNNTLRRITTREGLPYNNTAPLAEDQYGKVWLSSVDINFGGTICTIGQNGKTVYPFGSKDILSSVEDSKSNLWVGTYDGLFVVDSARKKYWSIDSAAGLSHHTVQSVSEAKGKVVITTNGGYNIFNPSNNQFARVSKKEGLTLDTVYTLMTDNRGNDWMVGTSAGIVKHDRENHLKFKINKTGGLNGDFIGQIMLLPDGKIVVLPDETGPAIIDPVKNTIQTIKSDQGLNASAYKTMMIDSKGQIWITGISHSFGLYMIDADWKTITRFGFREGLSNEYVASTLEHEGKILVTTSDKVNILTPPENTPQKKWKMDVLLHSESMKKSTGTFISDAITHSGNFLWGDAGMAVIYDIQPDTSKGRVYITGLKVNSRNLHFTSDTLLSNNDTSNHSGTKSLHQLNYTLSRKIRWDSLSGPYNIPMNFSLPYDQNVIQFQFVELNSGRIDALQYAYILEGIDKTWTFSKEPHTENYLNLSSGNYTFKVSSRWKNGKWNEPATFSFTIRPPWYFTWWAYTLYALLAALFVSFVVRLQKKSVISKERQRSDIREAQLKADAENERRKNIELISEMGKDITGSLSFKEIINTVYKHVNTMMDASIFGIGIYKKEKNQLEFPATKEKGIILPPYYYDVDDPKRPASWCFTNEKKVFINDFDKEHKNYISDIADTVAGDSAESVIYLPLIHKGKCMGVLTAQSFKKNAYNEYHLNIVESLATYAALAMDNAEAYRNLQSAQAQLIQSEKMASLGELTAGIAHEIQNPLNFVNNFSEINREMLEELKAELLKPTEKTDTKLQNEIINDVISNEEKILYHGKRADAIVKGMLQHSRSNTGTKEPTDINALADEYLRLSYHGLRAKDKSFNADFKTDFDESIGKIHLVPQDVGRVLLNLFNNAFYATREKLLNDGKNFAPKILVSSKKHPDEIEVSVKDNGNGISEQVLSKIFQPFYTTKPTGQGTGLGLSLSYDIIKAHGGEIKVQSKEGEGSEFTLVFPCG